MRSSIALALSGVALTIAAGCGASGHAPPSPSASTGSEDDAGARDPTLDAAPADAADEAPSNARYAAFAAAFDAERKVLNAPGAAVALMEHGHLTYAEGFGTKGPNSAEPVGARTLFRIGSMTKALTAAAFMRFVQAGRVSLDDPLTSVIPDVSIDDPENLPHVTMRRLLSHTSGLADAFLTPDDGTNTDDPALSQYLTGSDFAAAQYFNDPPGTFYDYANVNFVLTGLAIERLGGAYYRQLMHDTIFEPLGMHRTFFLPSEALADGDFTTGLATTDGNASEMKPDSYDTILRSAGYAFSSVLDYERFMEFLYAGNSAVLGDAERKEMAMSQVNTRELGDVDAYGLGLEIDRGLFVGDDFVLTPVVFHSGAIDGWASEFFLFPATGFGFVAFANADGAYFSDSLLVALRSFADLPPPSPSPNLDSDPATYPAIAGTYVDPTGTLGHAIITAGASGLELSLPDMDQAGITYDKTMTPEAPDVFSLSVKGLEFDPEVTFIKDGSGAYAWMRARYYVAKRAN